jgi:hypothetical protein
VGGKSGGGVIICPWVASVVGLCWDTYGLVCSAMHVVCSGNKIPRIITDDNVKIDLIIEDDQLGVTTLAYL